MEKVSDRVRINELHDVITRYRAVMEQALEYLQWIVDQRTGGMIERKAKEALTALSECLGWKK